ncbi:1596_t:CDS:2 [Cetraspora pellucida]|uniref:1596_t:CDS:1 n=1 Tax=Cetraspora pellucida TaxID=1433469 RepID=A0A9N9A4G1_9GLOM|nr:1596_t:CDS:2 [Cetraspora pellucida]
MNDFPGNTAQLLNLQLRLLMSKPCSQLDYNPREVLEILQKQMTTATTPFTSVDQCVPSLKTITVSNANVSPLIKGIPVTYILEKLHQLGPSYFNDKSTAFAELHIEGNSKFYWVHKEYLVLQSNLFNEIFDNVSNGDVITITLPSPDAFDPILEYFYDGDADKFYDNLTLDNFKSIWENVEYLEMGAEARAVCLAYYQNEVLYDRE